MKFDLDLKKIVLDLAERDQEEEWYYCDYII